MSDRQHPTGTAVFVDQTGRRRRLLKITGVAVGTLALASVVIVVGGLFTGTPLSVVGWPGDGPARPTPLVTTDEPTRQARPTPTTASTRPVVRRSPAPVVSPTPRATASSRPRVTRSPAGSEKPGRPPTNAPPATPAPPSREPTAPEQSPEPTSELPQPPGQLKTPPGRVPDKSTGPRK